MIKPTTRYVYHRTPHAVYTCNPWAWACLFQKMDYLWGDKSDEESKERNLSGMRKVR